MSYLPNTLVLADFGEVGVKSRKTAKIVVVIKRVEKFDIG